MYHTIPQSTHRDVTPAGSYWGSRTFWVFLAFVAIALTMLFSEHRAHFLGILPLLFLLACPLLHMFGHGGHGRHSPHRETVGEATKPSKEIEP